MLSEPGAHALIGLPALLIALSALAALWRDSTPEGRLAVGMTRLVVLLAALLAAAAAVQGSQATFTASATNAGASFATASKFPPTVTLTAPADGSLTNDPTPLMSGTATTRPAT